MNRTPFVWSARTLKIAHDMWHTGDGRNAIADVLVCHPTTVAAKASALGWPKHTFVAKPVGERKGREPREFSEAEIASIRTMVLEGTNKNAIARRLKSHRNTITRVLDALGLTVPTRAQTTYANAKAGLPEARPGRHWGDSPAPPGEFLDIINAGLVTLSPSFKIHTPAILDTVFGGSPDQCGV